MGFMSTSSLIAVLVDSSRTSYAFSAQVFSETDHYRGRGNAALILLTLDNRSAIHYNSPF